MFANPIVQSTLLPFVVSILLVGLLRLASRWVPAGRLGAASIGIAFLAVNWQVFGAPPFPPQGALQKLPYLATLGLVVGLLLDGWRTGDTTRRVVTGAWLLTVVVWLAAPRLQHPSFPFLLALCGVFVAALVVLFRVERLHSEDNVGPALVGAACLGLAAVAMRGSSATIFQLAVALAFAVAGFSVWNWPRRRDTYASLLLIGGAGTLLALATQVLLFSDAPPLAVAVLVLVFFADVPARRLWLRAGPWRDRLLPWYAFIAGLVPAGLALLIGSFFAVADDAYY